MTMLSSSASVPQLMKAVTWQIKPLSECPSSPCNNQPAAASTSSPASSTSPDNGNTVIQLTGNPLADLNMVYQLFTASASPFKIPTTLDPATAFELMTSKCLQRHQQQLRCLHKCDYSAPRKNGQDSVLSQHAMWHIIACCRQHNSRAGLAWSSPAACKRLKYSPNPSLAVLRELTHML